MGYADSTADSVDEDRLRGEQFVRIATGFDDPVKLDFGTFGRTANTKRYFTYHGSFSGTPTVLVSELKGPDPTVSSMSVAGTPNRGSFAAIRSRAGSVPGMYMAMGGVPAERRK